MSLHRFHSLLTKSRLIRFADGPETPHGEQELHPQLGPTAEVQSLGEREVDLASRHEVSQSRQAREQQEHREEAQAAERTLERSEITLALNEYRNLTPAQVETLEVAAELIRTNGPDGYHQENTRQANILLGELNSAVKELPPNLREAILRGALTYIAMGGENRSWMKEEERYQIAMKNGRLVAEQVKKNDAGTN